MLQDNREYSAEITGRKNYNSNITRQISASDFDPPLPDCVTQSDIEGVYLQAPPGDSDGWFVTSIATFAAKSDRIFTKITVDPKFNKWVDYDQTFEYEYNARHVPLSLVREDPNNVYAKKQLQGSRTPNERGTHRPRCGYGTPVCDCDTDAPICAINLVVEEIMTFTSYIKYEVGELEGIYLRGSRGTMYHIEDDGVARPLKQYAHLFCGDTFDPANCTDPLYVDGKTYRMALAVNGQVPGPTIIVREGQTVQITVHNNMTSEGISVHWHGMHQYNSPWMDGVGQVTQCQIGPASSYTYDYIARPSGTFWYHSHSGAQRTDGFFGALIVKETNATLNRIERRLSNFSVSPFQDRPDKHTITLLDWQREGSLDMFTPLHASMGFYPNVPIGELPPSNMKSKYEPTFSYDNGEVGPMPYFSGLINGKGRHSDVPYTKTRLSAFPVVQGQRYRFRLIGAQGLYAYKFSIAGHKLTVVNTDGYWTEPVNQVDYIIIHTGERYDFILDAKAAPGNYWIQAETLEIDQTSNGEHPPFKSLGHLAEAILQYVEYDIDKPLSIPSTEYQHIKANSPARLCNSDNMCHAVNCPFKQFHWSYYINCTNIDQLRLLIATEGNEMPKANPTCSDKCLHFFNFNFEGNSVTSAVNGRNFILPPAPPQTQHDIFMNQSTICDLEANFNPSLLDCTCTHVVDIPFNNTVQFVFSAVGTYMNSHPIHLHSHTFHIVHTGYPEHDAETGFIKESTPAVYCDDKDLCISDVN